MKSKSIEELEKELKKKTGLDTVPKGNLSTIKNTFNSSVFLKLAKEMKKIFSEDERHPNPTLKAI